MSRGRSCLGLFLLLAACSEKAATPATPAPVAEEPVSVLVDRELEQLTRLEAALRAQRQRVNEVDAGAFEGRLADALDAETQLLGRVRKTLATARSVPSADSRQRIEKVMTEARAVRATNEALWKDIQAELARAAPEAKTVE